MQRRRAWDPTPQAHKVSSWGFGRLFTQWTVRCMRVVNTEKTEETQEGRAPAQAYVCLRAWRLSLLCHQDTRSRPQPFLHQPPHVGPQAHMLVSLLVWTFLKTPSTNPLTNGAGKGLLPSPSLPVCAPGKCQLCPVSPPHVGHLVSVLQTVSCLPYTSSLRTASAISVWLWQWPPFSTLFLCWGNAAFS